MYASGSCGLEEKNMQPRICQRVKFSSLRLKVHFVVVKGEQENTLTLYVAP